MSILGKKEKEEEKKKSEEIEVYVPGEKIITISGELVEIPKLSWERELKVVQLLKDLLPLIQQLDTDKPDKFLPLLETVPGLAIKAAGHILNKDPEWCEKNLDFKRVSKVVGNFFSSLSEEISGLTGLRGLKVP